MGIDIIVYLAFGALLLMVVLCGIRIVRPTERGLIETFGKYKRFAKPGLNWVLIGVQRLIQVNVTERMSDIEPQEVITKDNLNTKVNLVVYYKTRSDEDSVKRSIYEVDDVVRQMETLARTTARNVIGTMPFKEVNSERDKINKSLFAILSRETKNWGVDVLKVELKDITPPSDVQETMNQVIKAENEKQSAIDFATAVETKADGQKRASIKEAEGLAQGRIIVAEANAKAIKIVNESAAKYFKGNAQTLKKYEVIESTLKDNSKIILGADNKSILKLFDINKGDKE